MNTPTDQKVAAVLRKVLIHGFPVALAAILAGFGGYVLGRAETFTPPPPSVPETMTCASDSSAASMARRNTVWRVWNDGPSAVPESPDRTLAAALGLMLARDADVAARNRGMQMYLQKSVAYFSREDIARIQRALGEATPAGIADALRTISNADHRAAELVRMVLADRERVDRYISGTPIPLETLPDGTTP